MCQEEATAQMRPLQAERQALKEAAEEAQIRVDQLQRTQRVFSADDETDLSIASIRGIETIKSRGKEKQRFNVSSGLPYEFGRTAVSIRPNPHCGNSPSIDFN